MVWRQTQLEPFGWLDLRSVIIVCCCSDTGLQERRSVLKFHFLGFTFFEIEQNVFAEPQFDSLHVRRASYRLEY